MQTLKIKINIDDKLKELIYKYQQQYSILLRTAFNYFNKEEELKSVFTYIINNSELLNKLKSLNNIDLMNSWFKQSAIKEAYQLYKNYLYRIDEYKQKIELKEELLQKQQRTKKENKQLRKLFKVKYPKVIFGGKNNFFSRQPKDKNTKPISKEQFKLTRLNPLYSIGTAKPYKGNRFFNINQDLSSITFKPKFTTQFKINLLSLTKGYKNILQKLYLHQEFKDLPITYKLDTQYIYISFEEDKLYKDNFNNLPKVNDRYCALDLNPNYIGYSIIDWKNSNEFKIIDSGVYSFKELNGIYKELKGTDSSDKKKKWLNNKRNYEIIEVAKNLINKCIYYKVNNFIVEDLNIKVKDREKGKDYNRLCNNSWIRNRFLNNIIKRCKIFKINYLQVKPEYSSFTR